jgi:hypothetical protein
MFNPLPYQKRRTHPFGGVHQRRGLFHRRSKKAPRRTTFFSGSTFFFRRRLKLYGVHTAGGLLVGGVWTGLVHFYISTNQWLITKYLIPASGDPAYVEARTNGILQLVWIDPMIFLSMIMIALMAMVVAITVIRNIPIRERLEFAVCVMIGIEIISCLYCFGYLTDSSSILVSLCPYLLYPRLGLLFLVVLNALAMILQKYRPTKWIGIVSLLVSCLVLISIVVVFIITFKMGVINT